jgi:hypothetical protein
MKMTSRNENIIMQIKFSCDCNSSKRKNATAMFRGSSVGAQDYRGEAKRAYIKDPKGPQK